MTMPPSRGARRRLPGAGPRAPRPPAPRAPLSFLVPAAVSVARRGRARGRAQLAALLAGAALLALPAGWLVAQETGAQETGGRVLRFDVEQTFTATENPELVAAPPRDSFIARTDLGVALSSATRAHSFTFSLGGAFEAGDFAGQQSGNTIVASHRLGLDYGYATRTAALDLDLDYGRSLRRAVLVEEFIGEDLLASGGEQSRLRLGFGLRTGIDQPWGFDLSGALTEIAYHDVPGDSLADRTEGNLQAGLRFSLTPRTDLTAVAGYRVSDRDDTRGYRSETRYGGLELSHAVREGLRLSAGLRQNEIETSEFRSETGLRETRRQSGLGGSVAAELDRPNGTVGLRIASDLFDTGRRDNYTLSRSLDLPQGRLSALVGVSDTERSDPRLQLGIGYVHQLRRSTVALELVQETVSSEDSEAQRSRLSLDWRGEFDRISGWEARVSLADYNVLSGPENDSRRADASLAYVRNLTEDWALRAGYSHSRADNDTYDSARTDNAVFLGLRSSFSLRP